MRRGARHYAGLGLLLIVSLVLMSEVFITAAILPELEAEFGVSKAQLGLLGSAYALMGAAIGLLFGHLTDTRSRKKMLILAVLLAEIPCLLSGFHALSGSFGSFLALRVLSGIGIGAIYPITLSLLADLFPANQRARASALIDITWSIGLLLGPLLGTWAAGTDYGWRAAFIAAGLPNLLILPLFALVFREPPRREAGAQAAAGLAAARQIFARRGNLGLFLQGIPGSIPWGILPFWSITFFNEVRGLSKAEATGLWEGFTIASALGIIAASWLGDRLHGASPRRALLAIALLSGLGAAWMALPINAPAPNGMLIWLALPAAILLAAPGPNVRAWLMHLNPPHQRGAVFAIFNLSDNIGKGLGPAIGGLLFWLSGSLTVMMNAMIGFWALHVILLALTARPYARELAAARGMDHPGQSGL